MAKLALINRNLKRQKIVAKYQERRKLLFEKINNTNLDDKERNISLFILLKKIGVVTEDNKIDSSKFKGLVLFVEDYNSKPGEIKKNPKYTVCYGYLFNRMYPLSYIEDYDFFIESYLIKGHKEWRRDYREFKKFDEQDRRIKELEKKLDRLENR